jgi:hypothetical protein
MAVIKLDNNPFLVIAPDDQENTIYFDDSVLAHNFAGQKKHITCSIKVRSGTFKFNVHKDTGPNSPVLKSGAVFTITFDNTEPNNEGVGGLHFKAGAAGEEFLIAH